MGRCQLLQMLAVLGVAALPTNLDRANAAEQHIAQADPAQAQQPKKQDDIPPGGCTPIGLTASGEMVFPLLCRALLEQQRGPISQDVSTSASKQDASVTASKKESPTAESKQDSLSKQEAPTTVPKQEFATTPPNPEPPTTTSAISRPETAPQIGAMVKPVIKRNPRRKQLAGEHGVGSVPVPTGSEVTGSVRR
jgi:hypothetical protein